MNIEETARDVRLAEQEIFRQVVAERDKRIETLQGKIEVLEAMLNRASAFGGGLPQPQPLPAYRQAPRRWSVR